MGFPHSFPVERKNNPVVFILVQNLVQLLQGLILEPCLHDWLCKIGIILLLCHFICNWFPRILSIAVDTVPYILCQF